MKNFFIKILFAVQFCFVTPNQMNAEILSLKTEYTAGTVYKKVGRTELKQWRKQIRKIRSEIRRNDPGGPSKAGLIVGIILLFGCVIFFLGLGLTLLLLPLALSGSTGAALGYGIPCVGIGVLFLLGLIQRIRILNSLGQEEVSRRPPTQNTNEVPKQ